MFGRQFCPVRVEMSSFVEWLSFHEFDREMLLDVLAAWKAGALLDRPVWLPGAVTGASREIYRYRTREECFEALVRPAFEAAFKGHSFPTEYLARVAFQDLPQVQGIAPHTVDRGPSEPVLIVMKWDRMPDDVICLAHEAAHVLQTLMSGHGQMPPVARETCAFLGELILLEHVRETAPALFPALACVWHRENEAYLGTDVDVLSAALADPQVDYHYRQNYPLARLAAIRMFSQGRGDWLHALFGAGHKGMRHLPVADMANLAAEVENYLPPLPQADPERPALDAYRSLGAMALIDIDYWEGPSQTRIEDYYAVLLRHLQEQTAFVALNEQRKPIGYATWTKPARGNGVILTRQAAPFGNHLALQRALEKHLGTKAEVLARHNRSARQQQTAW